LFRGEDEDTIKATDAFSERFEIDVVNRCQTAHPEIMAQLASHGDLDINKQEAWEKYYDDPAVYYKLRRIKKEVDPEDVFHSRFTVRPALVVKVESDISLRIMVTIVARKEI